MHACLIPVKGYVNLEAEIVHATLWGQRISGRAIGGGTRFFSSTITRLPPRASRFAKTAPSNAADDDDDEHVVGHEKGNDEARMTNGE